MIGDILLRPSVVISAAIFVAYAVYQIFLKPSSLEHLPIVGAKEGDWFPYWQALYRNTKDFKAALKYAYKHYREQAVRIPVLSGLGYVMLPLSDLQWQIEQPDDVLSMHECAMASLQIDHTTMDPSLIHNPIHNHIITTKLTNQIGNLVPDMIDETAFHIDKSWGTSTTEYREVCVYDTLRFVIAAVTNRVFIGLPYCRNDRLLDLGMAFAQDIPLSSEILKLLPRSLRGLAALVITIPNRIHWHKFINILRPEIEMRVKNYDEAHADPEKKTTEPEPNDFLQWCLQQAKETGDPKMWRPETLAARILLLNFASIHTSSFALTHAVIDLVCSKQEYIDELREEISTVLAENGGEWNKRALAKMEKLDSVMRESQRVNSFVSVAVARRVVAPEGVTTASGVHLPKGSTPCTQGYSIHKDPSIYPDAHEFQPFRFAEKRADHSEEYIKRARMAFATTSTEYLAFGGGKNACPGRFFAAAELKLMLAHILMTYDFEIQPSRPHNVWLGLNRIPPMKATIKVKRREKSS